MKIPGTLLSKFGPTLGMSTPRLEVPKTSLMASTGHAVRHAPWPMQCAPFVSTAQRITDPFGMVNALYTDGTTICRACGHVQCLSVLEKTSA